MKKQDAQRYMLEAIALARRAEGMTRPNPPVGALVVKDGQIIGRGYHRKAGGPHAEVYALRQAGERAVGAELFVTLEPCSTHGRTPPCVERIIASGIKQVYWSVLDPNPKHAGRAEALLRSERIRVFKGICEDAGHDLLAPFAMRTTQKRPYVTLKCGMTLDGKIADRYGKSQWITGPAARAEVQSLRRRVDAILVGANTVMADNPSLLPRPDRGRRPWRVILDPKGRVSHQSSVFADDNASQTIIALGPQVTEQKQNRYTRAGAHVLVLPRTDRRIVSALLRALAEWDVMHVLCEGGGVLAESLICAGVVDEYYCFVAPSFLGGSGLDMLRGQGWTMQERPRLVFQEIRNVGEDVLIRARPARVEDER